MSLNSLDNSTISLFISIISIVLVMLSASVHELAHAYTAYKLGDATAKEAGRLTLNPFAHLDLFGSFLLPLMLSVIGGPVIAYAKPVPYNPYRLKHQKRDEVLVALAGPASNLIQALIAAIIYQLLPVSLFIGAPVLGSIVFLILNLYIQANVFLLFFNLLPLPPLDGSKIIYLFLNNSNRKVFDNIQHYSMAILLALLYLLPEFFHIDILNVYFTFTADKLLTLLIG